MKALIKELNIAEFSIVWTKNQTEGKGQPGNSWESEQDKNLTFSFLLKPHFIEVKRQFRITQVVALALIDVLSQFVDDVSIKWPNDIYVGDNKIAGILIENTLLGNSISNSIIGIGLNVNQLKFTSNAPNPISLKQITGNDFNLENLLQRYMTCFFDRYLQWIEQDTDSELTNLYVKHLYRSTGYHKYSDSTGLFMAKFERIKETGHLVLQTDKGENRIFAFKEVSYII